MYEYLSFVAQRMTVSMIMTQRSDLVCVSSTQSVGDARELMGSSFDQLPVMEGEQLQGLVSARALEDVEATRGREPEPKPRE